MSTEADHKKLKKTYEEIALSEDENTTACDFRLRELEMELALQWIRDGDSVLDVGCGMGVALRKYATDRRIQAFGIDYAENMIAVAKRRLEEKDPHLAIEFRTASVTDLPYDDATFDVVTSHRCLMALLDWGLQQDALKEIHRVLKPGGTLVLMEGTLEGTSKLNHYRSLFHLPEIDPAGRDRLTTLKFREKDLLEFIEDLYELVRIQRFGMYYFLTRIVQPLLVAPESPRYDHELNQVARQIASLVPDFEGVGHLAGFIIRKRP